MVLWPELARTNPLGAAGFPLHVRAISQVAAQWDVWHAALSGLRAARLSDTLTAAHAGISGGRSCLSNCS